MTKRLTVMNPDGSITMLQYVPTGYYVADQNIIVNATQLLNARDRIEPVNFKFTNTVLEILTFTNLISAAKHTVQTLRTYMNQTYGPGENLSGHCIEAAELLVRMLRANGVSDARSVDGFCRLDDGSGFANHSWTEIYGPEFETKQSKFWYADITAEQFNDAMNPENQFQEIMLQPSLPATLCYEKPAET